jgi:sigma-B regulation protein RsbU (phosphoserine phosphatase)
MTSAHPIRLLMLEDSPLDAELVERELRRAQLHFSVDVVDSEDGFRSALENSDPDVILSDYHLPGFDGVVALRIARTVAPETPFIFVSGSIGEERAVEVLREGATDYVLKDRLSRLPSAIVRATAERREHALRRNVEAALRSSEQRFQYAAAATREIIWDWNLATARIWFSDSMRTFWGADLAHTDVEARWFEQRIHPGDRAEAMTCFREAVARKDRWSAEFRFARADGSFSPVLVRGMVVTDARGEPVRLIGAMFDMTERLQLERQLEQHRRIESLGRVAATVAHEFNNVLMGLLPCADQMARGGLSADAYTRMASLLLHSVSRGRSLTDQILSFSKPAEPEPVRVALDEWLYDVLPDLRALAGHRATVAVETPASTLAVSIDPLQMQQVLSNLVVNAGHAMPKGGTITIAAEADGDTVSLAVTDEGTGMSAETMDHIFEPLFTTKRTGTGLGLAVAQQIVMRHRGSIQVTSTPGKGSTFTIVLPLSHGSGGAGTLPSAPGEDMPEAAGEVPAFPRTASMR